MKWTIRRSTLVMALLTLLLPARPGAGADPEVRHPMDALVDAEYAATREILRREGKTDADSLFQTITLREMPKAAVLAWKPGQPIHRSSEVVVRVGEAFFRGIVDLTARGVTSWERLADVQPGVMFDEWEIAQEVTKADPGWQAAMRRRGVDDFEQVFCAPLTVGDFGREEDRGRRLLGVPCFHLGGSRNNMYGRPIGGLVAFIDLDAHRVTRLIDNGPVTLPERAHNYDEASVGALRGAARPVVIAAPEGANYRLDGHVVTWGSWRFHFRMDKRAGLVISQAAWRDGERERPVLYQGHVSELFVPYMDPSDEWYWRTFLDAGEYGLGLLASPLAAGSDCPAGASFSDASIQLLGDGAPVRLENVVCLFERPSGAPLWRHGESLNQTHESRPRTDLVIRMIAQVGNYDYVIDWVFTTDGALRVDVGATGIDIVKAVASKHLDDPTAAADTEHGTLVAPNLVAPNHDHFVNVRLDLDVDGPVNSFVPGRFTRHTLPAPHPRRSLWRWDSRTVARREADARMRVNLERPAHWQVINPARRNAMGYPVSYALMLRGAVVALLDADDTPQRRAAFTDYHLWVTPYDPDERYAAGRFPNQSRGGEGLPAWTRGNRSIEKTDLVLWATLGFRHVPAAEDWPVLPTKWRSLVVRPFNFFDRNPAIDLRRPTTGTRLAPEVSEVEIETSQGSFTVELRRRWAPIGADRFHHLVRIGYYDDSRFFRVREGFIAQFGIAGDPALSTLWRHATIPDDPVRESNVRGTLAFAMTGPDTRSTQIYINTADNRRLDAQGFAPIGRVVAGMDVVDRLYSGYDEAAGGGMRGGQQDEMFAGGNRHLDARFPRLDRLIRATILRQ